MYNPPISPKWELPITLDEIVAKTEFALIERHELVLLWETKNTNPFAHVEFAGFTLGYSGKHNALDVRSSVYIWDNISDWRNQGIATTQEDIYFMIFCFCEQQKTQ